MELGKNKPLLLNQVKQRKDIDVNQLVKLIDTYDDLGKTDFQGYVSDELYSELLGVYRDPSEKKLWEQIVNMLCYTLAEKKEKAERLNSYIQQYPNSIKLNDAKSMLNALKEEIATLVEGEEWNMLDQSDYNALKLYRDKHPNSFHMGELDELMWRVTSTSTSVENLKRYINDWCFFNPVGKHVDEAKAALSGIDEWERIKNSSAPDKLFLVDAYRDSHPNSPFKNEIDELYSLLRDEELNKMKISPAEYGKDKIERFFNAGIFSWSEFEREGLITHDSWESLQVDRNLFPNIQDFQIEDSNIEAPEGCTDVYLFGTPGTGKTCLLMGLSGAEGCYPVAHDNSDKSGTIEISYTLDTKTLGGPYSSALQQYVRAGITPGRTYGKFVTIVNGSIREKRKDGKVQDHPVNFVEMSGEEFARRIADGDAVSFEDMGTGATKLLCNNNRKVFFIIVDGTKDMVKVDFVEDVTNSDGIIIDQVKVTKYVSQLDILGKFASLLSQDRNQNVMKNVDAIHFVVTKADVLGGIDERVDNAHALLHKRYPGPIAKVKKYCDDSQRINFSTNYKPQVFTFSLGKFYLGDVFEFDSTETLKIVNTICQLTVSERKQSWWEKAKSKLAGDGK